MPAKSECLEPVRGKLIVRRMEPETQTKLGIVLPESYRQNQRKKLLIGTILAVGEPVPGRYVFPFGEGTRILFGQYAGTEIEHSGEKLLVMTFDDVLASVVD